MGDEIEMENTFYPSKDYSKHMFTPSEYSRARSRAKKEESFGVSGYVGLGMTLAGGWLGATQDRSKGSFDYDPQKRALGRYKELTDPNSQYWRNIKKYHSEVAAEGSATMNTLTGFAKAGGMSEQGASSLGFNQARANETRVREGVSKGIFQQFLATEGQAAGYLGMEYDRSKTEYSLREQDRLRAEQESGEFAGDLFKSGASLLSLFI